MVHVLLSLIEIYYELWGDFEGPIWAELSFQSRFKLSCTVRASFVAGQPGEVRRLPSRQNQRSNLVVSDFLCKTKHADGVRWVWEVISLEKNICMHISNNLSILLKLKKTGHCFAKLRDLSLALYRVYA